VSAPLVQEIYERAAAALRSVPDRERGDTYVVSFFVYDEEDDPRLPTITFGTNTETQVRLAANPPADFVKPNPWWEPADPEEARWNYAFWQQNNLGVFFSDTVEHWLRETGMWLDDPQGDDDEDAWEALEQASERITPAFALLCAEAARRLHDDGVIVEVFGRPIPVVIHELEYYDAIADETEAANPAGLAAEFIAWVRNG